MYSYHQQGSYWGEGNYQCHNDMVNHGSDVYNERYQPVYSPLIEGSNIERMLAQILAGQNTMTASLKDQAADITRMKQDINELFTHTELLETQLARQANQSWENEYEDGVDGTYDDELLEYSLGQLGQAEKELCEDNASLFEGCIPETPEYPPTIDKFEASVDSEIELELSTLVDDPTCEEYIDPSLHPTEENSRMNLDVLEKKEQEEWASLHFIEDFKRMSILLEVNDDDPFLVMPPPNKFEYFRPFIVELDSKGTHCPLILQAIIHLRRMGMHLEVHCRLDGRKFKWDLKVD